MLTCNDVGLTDNEVICGLGATVASAVTAFVNTISPPEFLLLPVTWNTLETDDPGIGELSFT